MRHRILAILMTALLFTALGTQSTVAQPATATIYIDGKQLVADVSPVIRQDRVMVPLRAIGEGLGLAVNWDAANYFVMISTNESYLMAPAGVVGSPQSTIRIFYNGGELKSDADPFILNDRTMVPLRLISEEMGMEVDWRADSYEVFISRPAADTTHELPNLPPSEQILDPVEELPAEAEPVTDYEEKPISSEPTGALDMEALIMGQAQVDAQQLRALLYRNNPNAPDLIDLYLEIGAKYGVRGDLAFCQAAKETGWWRFTGIVQPWQNNYCGLGATGVAATGDEDLLGADPSCICYEEGYTEPYSLLLRMGWKPRSSISMLMRPKNPYRKEPFWLTHVLRKLPGVLLPAGSIWVASGLIPAMIATNIQGRMDLPRPLPRKTPMVIV